MNAENLVDMIKRRASASDDPAKAFDDIVALSTTGIDPEILILCGEKFAREQPHSVSPITGRIAKIENNAVFVDSESSHGATECKTFDAIFIDEAGKRISPDKAKTALVGKQSIVFSAKEGTDWVVKSVISK